MGAPALVRFHLQINLSLFQSLFKTIVWLNGLNTRVVMSVRYVAIHSNGLTVIHFQIISNPLNWIAFSLFSGDYRRNAIKVGNWPNIWVNQNRPCSHSTYALLRSGLLLLVCSRVRGIRSVVLLEHIRKICFYSQSIVNWVKCAPKIRYVVWNDGWKRVSIDTINHLKQITIETIKGSIRTIYHIFG